MCPRAGLDVCEISRPHRDSIPTATKAKVKVQFALEQATKAQRERSIALLFL
jgi:hypothetical protein